MTREIKSKPIFIKNSSGELQISIERLNGSGFTVEHFIKGLMQTQDLTSWKHDPTGFEQFLKTHIKQTIEQLFITIC